MTPLTGRPESEGGCAASTTSPCVSVSANPSPRTGRAGLSGGEAGLLSLDARTVGPALAWASQDCLRTIYANGGRGLRRDLLLGPAVRGGWRAGLASGRLTGSGDAALRSAAPVLSS